jgi:1,4-alpha-glucan branching enzyme
MVSLSNQTRFSFHPNNLVVSEKRRLGISGVNFPRKIKLKITCFAAERPRQEKQKKKSQSQSTSDAEAGVDPVGFLTRLGIADRIFAQFLRERYKNVSTLILKKWATKKDQF